MARPLSLGYSFKVIEDGNIDTYSGVPLQELYLYQFRLILTLNNVVTSWVTQAHLKQYSLDGTVFHDPILRRS